ncbi:MAG TPA: LPS export ABC transporter permease LptF [Pseudobdellovibrionaceae bacterium]|nr:LPS export ABC transporter permease LptF [Pseudobdellovibrionaceae bacterium]
MKNKKLFKYLFFEVLPSFILGLVVFLLVILMFQILRLTEFALIHGIEFETIVQIIGYICISLLPALLPMSLLFAILMTYGRLSQDSEILAMKASGVSTLSIISPAIALSLIVGFISAQTSFEIAPWGNRQFEVIYTQIGNNHAGASIKEGAFSEGFFNMVVFANKVNSEKGLLEDLFIFNEQDPEAPTTIVAQTGQILQTRSFFGNKALLRLFNGNIHRQSLSHTKIQFESYDLYLNSSFNNQEREKSPQSLTLREIKSSLTNPNLKKEDLLTLKTEYHKRWAISFLCIIFALIGVGLGITTNRRSAKAGGFILSIGIIVIYWILYITMEGLSRQGSIPPALAIWAPNLIFAFIGGEALRRNWN